MIQAFVPRGRSAGEQIGVAAGSDEDQFAGLKFVEQDPDRFHMAVPVAFPFTAQGMERGTAMAWAAEPTDSRGLDADAFEARGGASSTHWKAGARG